MHNKWYSLTRPAVVHFNPPRDTDRIVAYRTSHPGRPVFLIGHSGGTAVAVWAAEVLRDGQKIDGIVLLASSLSSGYDLCNALKGTRGGIVSFYSERDSVLLGAGTTLFGTMDGRHTEAAGKVGFSVPKSGQKGKLYERFSEIKWTPNMVQAGNDGSHFGCLSTGFISSYVTPLLATAQWWPDTIEISRNSGNRGSPLALASK